MSNNQKYIDPQVAEIEKNVKKNDIIKFALASLVGGFLFLVPIKYEQSFTIPLGIIIDFVSEKLTVNNFSIPNLMVLIFLTLSTVFSLVGYIFKPDFIMKNERVKELALVPPLYMISKIIGTIIIIMVYFKIGPDVITSAGTGGSMLGVSATLVTVVLTIAFTMPLLTDFGIMEFVGVLIRDLVRPLFTCPGRSAIDLITSWLGASNAAVILTKRQYETGYYTGREAAVISTNFSLVSIPFCYVIAKMIGVDQYFTVWYLIILITGIALAIITPRIPPLKNIPDTYDEIAGKQINETVPEGVSHFKWALLLAGQRAHESSFKDVIKSGVDIYLSVFLDLIPVVMAWGTIVLILVEHTQIFQFASIPLGYYMQVLGIEGAMEVAPATLVGFADMYIPALLIQNFDILRTKFIVGAVSLIQIIYMTEVGIIIVKSRIPINTWKLFLTFMVRTIIAIPAITLLTNLLVKF